MAFSGNCGCSYEYSQRLLHLQLNIIQSNSTSQRKPIVLLVRARMLTGHGEPSHMTVSPFIFFLPLDCCIIPIQKFVVAFLTYLSGRPDDNPIRASHPRHARVLSESEASTIWNRGLPSWNGSLPSIALHQPAPKGDVQRVLRASWWRICSWT
jgi:hypothetical protein